MLLVFCTYNSLSLISLSLIASFSGIAPSSSPSLSSQSIVHFPYPPFPINESKLSHTTETVNKSVSNASSVASNDFLQLYEAVKTCFESQLQTSWTGTQVKVDSLTTPTVISYNSTQDPIIIVDNWIDKSIADSTIILAECVRIHAPQNHEYRPFGGSKYGGGNNVTFLNQFMQAIYPQALDQILSVAGAVTETVGWRPHPHHLGIRCIELLEYEARGEL